MVQEDKKKCMGGVREGAGGGVRWEKDLSKGTSQVVLAVQPSSPTLEYISSLSFIL